MSLLLALTFASMMDPVLKAGTRLEIRWDSQKVAGIDGRSMASRSEPYFYDTSLNHRCNISDWKGGLYCIPTNDHTPLGYYPTYTDSTCSTRMISVHNNPAPPVSEIYAHLEGEPYQGDTEITTTATSFFYKTTLGRCDSGSLASFGAGWRFFAAKPATPVFVPFTRSSSVEKAP